ncbi:MAG: amidohydrolase family protein, partial [Flavobacteriales bacterium]|nr:amidohydrolase family protein [Flavobacteriales bacterium]
MKIIRIVALLFITQSVLAQETFPVNGVSNNFEPIYAFTNARIVLNPTTEIPNGTLLIKGNEIIAVDSNLNIPKGAIIKDLAGDYIYPSFIDLYSDYGLKEVQRGKYNYRPQYDSKKAGAYHWNEAIHPEINASTEWSKYNSEAKPYLENGFGAVLSHAKDGIARGTATFVALSDKTDNENILIKDAAAFYSFKKGVSKQKNPSSLMGSIALLRQTYFDAEWYELQNSQTNLSYNSFINQQELPQFFAINDELDYNRVYKIAEEFEIDYILKGSGKEFLRIDEVANTEFPIIIPINFPSSYDISNPETTEWISLQNLKTWESAPYNPAILAKNGIEFCITAADLKDSKDFLKNLRLAITKGLNKGDALAALTTNPATLIEINDKVGSLAKGKLANFFIASKDIFENGIIYENWTLGEKH